MKHRELQVLYIITKLELGGAQKVCLMLHKGLQQEQHISLLLSTKEGPLIEQVQQQKNVILLPIQKKNIFHYIYVCGKTFITLIFYIKKLHQQYPNLIVHTHSTIAGVIGRWAAFFARIPYRVHTIHGYAFHQHQSFITWFVIYSIEFITSLITTHFVCVSSADVKTGIKLFPQFSEKHSIIRAAIDWQQFYIPAYKIPTFPEQKIFVIGTISCFKPQKNVFDLLTAFAYAYQQNNNLRLEIIGDGALRTSIEQWIMQQQLTKIILLHGWQEKVAPIMFNWHAFALSSLWEGLPCAIVEARLLKLPIIAYDTGGIHDVIMSGENGFLCKPGDWQTLAKNIVTLSSSNNLYHQFQQYHDNLHEFNHEHMIKEHIKLYKSLRN